MSSDLEVFTRIGDHYDEIFAAEVAHTEAQADFVQRICGLRPGQRVLDVCCGPGRHALALARRGLAVTGVDRNPVLLAMGRRRAQAAALTVRWIQADARHLPHLGTFHAAICLFASWGYGTTPAEDAAMLAGIAQRVQPGGRLLLDTPSAQWLGRHPQGTILSVGAGIAVREQRSFDATAGRLEVTWYVRPPDRRSWHGHIRYHVYRVAEVEAMLDRCGLLLEAAYGDYAGAPLGPQAPRALLVARRPLPLAPPPAGG